MKYAGSTISELILEKLTPKVLELSLAVQNEVSQRLHEVDEIHNRQLQRTQLASPRSASMPS